MPDTAQRARHRPTAWPPRPRPRTQITVGQSQRHARAAYNTVASVHCGHSRAPTVQDTHPDPDRSSTQGTRSRTHLPDPIRAHLPACDLPRATTAHTHATGKPPFSWLLARACTNLREFLDLGSRAVVLPSCVHAHVHLVWDICRCCSVCVPLTVPSRSPLCTHTPRNLCCAPVQHTSTLVS